ncbi:AraC family transcriptional regulator [Lacrimispora saccharolytica]|uniref:Transcriptional regulator, AraC family n=1 Tax=Lacrimispora saccharolytica (strain ATCC 35040 / DSM 2544 / NRCC 2533 / WM1) TaxID=610130 RepID=D9R6V5_LACSW|nr:AraC family transcriptional regulator [Lacrimispora saccharolytica]ADL03611.1 transcriptional regulator, AraC family [[Clostridium] saccharolyticum WM1]QRV18246.1 helix-turn-helix transcriptional regulator [Lacrimispora saccharolytica]
MPYCSTPLTIEFDIREIITVHYFEYMKDFVFSGEAHDFWEFLYVDKGEITVQADHSIYHLKAGDVIFHKPNEFHALKAMGNKAPNLVAISFRCNSSSMKFFEEKSCSLNQDERFLLSRIIAEARQAFSTPLHIPSVEKVELASSPPFGAAQLILLYLQIFLIHVKRNHFEADSAPIHAILTEQMAFSSNSTHLEQIIQFMEFHICEHLSIKTICDEFSISRSTLHSLFHREKDCGAIDYFNFMKIERSKEIMRDGNMNFTEIAYYLSYSSLQYFSKQFKKTTGMSPLEYFNSVKKYSNEITNASKKKGVDDRMI